jgi:metallophosphoesterase superfamily enzyme
VTVEGDWIAVIGDLHAPYIDIPAFVVTCKIINDLDPFAIVLNGDNLDCYQVSKYSQDPKRKLELQSDILHAKEAINSLKMEARDAQVFYTEGNHERRMTDYVWKNAEVSSLDALTIPSLLGFDASGVTWLPERERLMFGDWLITHGTSCCSKGWGHGAEDD